MIDNSNRLEVLTKNSIDSWLSLYKKRRYLSFVDQHREKKSIENLEGLDEIPKKSPTLKGEKFDAFKTLRIDETLYVGYTPSGDHLYFVLFG